VTHTVRRNAGPAGRALVPLAYETWGEDAPDHLLGDWPFGPGTLGEETVPSKYHFGNTGLRWPAVYVCLSRKSLHALGIPRRLNEWLLASSSHGPL
jgi:hypothetical protein